MTGSDRLFFSFFNAEVARQYLPAVLDGLVLTIGLAIVIVLSGVSLGLVLAVLRALGSRLLNVLIIVFALLPAFGISNAAATMVGQNLGARHPERAERAVWAAVRYNMLFLGAIGVLFLIAAAPITAIFTDGPEVAAYASTCLRVVSLGFVFYAAGMVLTQAFNGAGDTWTPTLINLFVFWVFELPLAWYLAIRAGLGPVGVFIALTVAYSSLAVVSAWLFRGGKWKTKEI